MIISILLVNCSRNQEELIVKEANLEVGCNFDGKIYRIISRDTSRKYIYLTSTNDSIYSLVSELGLDTNDTLHISGIYLDEKEYMDGCVGVQLFDVETMGSVVK